MKAYVTYTNDGKVDSLGIGESLQPDDDVPGAQIDLPADFPTLSGRDAEREVARAVARLGRPAGTT